MRYTVKRVGQVQKRDEDISFSPLDRFYRRAKYVVVPQGVKSFCLDDRSSERVAQLSRRSLRSAV